MLTVVVPSTTRTFWNLLDGRMRGTSAFVEEHPMEEGTLGTKVDCVCDLCQLLYNERSTLEEKPQYANEKSVIR